MHPDITHHLASSHTITPPYITSLLSATLLIKLKWLSELLTLLDPCKSPYSLEHTFTLPPEGYFILALLLHSPQHWRHYNHESLMKPGPACWRSIALCLCTRKDSKPLLEYQEVVECGRAEYKVFTVNSDVVHWQKTLVWVKALAEEKECKGGASCRWHCRCL